MLYEEIQFEEKAVQLIPEDFETLSEYSWDMTGYTSRFGFFYLGNEKADVKGHHILKKSLDSAHTIHQLAANETVRHGRDR